VHRPGRRRCCWCRCRRPVRHCRALRATCLEAGPEGAPYRSPTPPRRLIRLTSRPMPCARATSSSPAALARDILRPASRSPAPRGRSTRRLPPARRPLLTWHRSAAREACGRLPDDSERRRPRLRSCGRALGRLEAPSWGCFPGHLLALFAFLLMD
jgi:hypothetical protein